MTWHEPLQQGRVRPRLMGVAAALALVAALVGTRAPRAVSKPVGYPANMDFASGGYGKWSSAALADPSIAGVTINLYWRQVEPSRGSYNWRPLDTEMAAWAQAGKRVALIARFANEKGGGCPGGYLPSWEIARIPTFCDTDLNSTIPDYFSTRFQSDWKAFIQALGNHLAASPYRNAVAYVRAGTGLGGESFYLMYSRAGNTDFGHDKQKLVAWGYSPQAWEAFQENLLAFYKRVLPYQDTYVIDALDVNPTTGNPVQVDVAHWAAAHGDGVGEECIPASSFHHDYADINEITAWVHKNYPNAYIQFQTCGVMSGPAEVAGVISDAESHWGRSIEWYEKGITTSSYQSEYVAYQRWVNKTFQGGGGSQLWLGYYAGPSAHNDFPVSVAVDNRASAVFVTGNSQSSGGTTDFATVAYRASTGAKLWAGSYGGIRGAGGNAAAVDAGGGRVFVTGDSPGPGSGTDYATIAYNAATGARLWLRRYDGLAGSHNFAFDVAVSPNGSRVFVTGSGQGADATGDYVTVAYDAATGRQLWVSRYSGPGSTEDHGASLAVSPDSATVYVTGRSGPDFATIAYNAVTGAQLWASRRPGEGSSIAVSPDGHVVYVTGTSGLQSATVAYNAATGTQQWERSYAGHGTSLAVSPSGNMVYVTGPSGSYIYATVAYNAATGARQWVRRYRRADNFVSGDSQVAAGLGGHTVYITGGSGQDIVTVAYNAATGASRWTRLRRGKGISLAVSPGTVFVTGIAHPAASADDFITVAYHG